MKGHIFHEEKTQRMIINKPPYGYDGWNYKLRFDVKFYRNVAISLIVIP